jgi:hypothetical protein
VHLTLLSRLVREDQRWTIEETCAAFERAAREMGEDATLSVRQLRRWMDGKVKRPQPVSRRVAEQFWGYPFKVLVGPAEVTSQALALGGQHHLPSGEVPHPRGEAEAGDPTDRRQAIQAFGSAFLSAGMVIIGSFAEAPALGQQLDMSHDVRHRRLAASSSAHLDEIVAHLREQWHVLVRTDNLLGPRFAIVGVLNQIAVIEELCAGLRGEQRHELVRLGAQYAESAAWLYEDSGNMPLARYWTSRAMELAHEGGDERMLAWTIFRRSQQAAAELDIAQAIGLAQAARRNEEQLATPTRAAIRVQEAYSHALDGNEQAAQRLLDDAHTWAASDTAGDAHEGHGSYCTPSYIEIQRANCWLTTGKPSAAITLYEEALATLPLVYQRSRAAALSRLAVAYIADGQLEQAASTAHEALPVAQTGGSMRIVDEVRGVGRQLAPYRKLQGVAALLDDLEDGER